MFNWESEVQETLTILILAAHIGSMNLASAGPLVGVWLGLGGKTAGAFDEQAFWGRRLIWWSLGALMLGMTLGGLLLLLSPGKGLWSALGRFPVRTYWLAGAELVISLFCLVMLAANWGRFAKRRWLRPAMALFSSANLLYHFPPWMAVVGLVAADRHWTGESVIEHAQLLELMARGEVFALSIHFTIASFAIAGVATLGLVLRREPSGEISEEGCSVARRAAAVAGVATVLQVPIGVWMLAGSATSARVALMGGEPIPSLALLGALTLTVFLLQRLLAVALGECERRYLRQILWVTACIVLLMATSLRLSRSAKPHSTACLPSETPPVLVASTHSNLSCSSCSSASSSSESASPPAGSCLHSSSEPPGSLPCAISSPKVGLESSPATECISATFLRAAMILSGSFLSVFLSSSGSSCCP